MTIKIGEKIRELRKKNDITQERLAEYLGITAQAVSRWESETCYPDLEVLPGLASFFNVTTDELLCYDRSEQEQSALLKKLNGLALAGKSDEAISEARRGLALYPLNHEIALHLAAQLMTVAKSNEAVGAENDTKYLAVMNEAIALCRRILRDCGGGDDRGDALRLNAKNLLIPMLCSVNRREEALPLALNLPSLTASREIVLQRVLKGEDRIQFSLSYLPLIVIMLNSSFLNGMAHADADKSTSLMNYSFDECRRDIAVWDAVYAQQDKADHQAAKRSVWIYMFLHQRAAKTKLDAGDTPAAAEYFKLAVECLPFVDNNQLLLSFNLVERNALISKDPQCRRTKGGYAGKSSAFVLLNGYVENGCFAGLEGEPVYIEALEKLKGMLHEPAEN